MMWVWITLGVLLLIVIIYDICQRQHAIVRNYPILGHLRYLLEAFGPELRQYIVTNNDEERPFSRDQRRWVYTSSKRANNYFGFGSDNEMEQSASYLIIKHATLPLPVKDDAHSGGEAALPCAKVMGAARGRARAFRPQSVVNISGMSFGALSGPAVEALNKGAQIAGCLQNTGEGGLSRHHQHGGQLIWQIGTGYFGCREADGSFCLERFLEVTAANPVRAIEIKLSQGAKPGVGALVPACKVSHEIAQIRGVAMGEDCRSPANHSAFRSADEMLDFVELLAERSGLPIGIKSAVGELVFWRELAHLMATTERGVDFITIDGGEGGTGAGPLVFTDHVGLPFKLAMARVYRIFAERDLHERIVFIGSGKLGFPDTAVIAMALGCDMINVGREAMLSIGCIQAQRCHTGRCPTGVTTHNRWLARGLDPTLKSVRCANYLSTLRQELLALSQACGVAHPGLINSEHLEFLDGRYGAATPMEVFNYRPGWGLPSVDDQELISAIMLSGGVAPEPTPARVATA